MVTKLIYEKINDDPLLYKNFIFRICTNYVHDEIDPYKLGISGRDLYVN